MYKQKQLYIHVRPSYRIPKWISCLFVRILYRCSMTILYRSTVINICRMHVSEKRYSSGIIKGVSRDCHF